MPAEFEVLGLQLTASKQQVRQACLHLARQKHPDKAGTAKTLRAMWITHIQTKCSWCESAIATDLQGHTMKNLVRVLVKKTPQIKKLQCRQSGLKSLPAEKPNAAIGLKDSDALCTLGTASGAHPPFPLSLTLFLSHWRKVRHWRAASTPDLSATKAATPHPTFTYKNESRKTCVAVSPGEV